MPASYLFPLLSNFNLNCWDRYRERCRPPFLWQLHHLLTPFWNLFATLFWVIAFLQNHVCLWEEEPPLSLSEHFFQLPKSLSWRIFMNAKLSRFFINTPNPILCWHEFHLLCFDWLLMLRKRGRNRSFLVFAFRFLFILGLRQACIVSVQICLFVFVAAKCLL